MSDASDKTAALTELKHYSAWDSVPALTLEELEEILTDTKRATTWAASTAYVYDQVVLPTANNRNGRRYRCIKAGTSGTTEPSWLTSQGATQGDGTGNLTWQEDGPQYKNIYDVRGAIHRAWLKKAAKAAQYHDHGLDSDRFSQSQVHKHCVDMAAKYAPLDFG